MTLISLEDAKAEVRKVVQDFKTRYDINYRLNNLPSIEIEEEAEQTEPNSSEKPNNCDDEDIFEYCPRCGMRMLVSKPKDEPQTDGYISGKDFMKIFEGQTERRE